MPSLKIRLLLLRDDNYTRSTIDYDCTVDCFVASGAHTYTFAPALVTAISIFFSFADSSSLLFSRFSTLFAAGEHTDAIFFLRLNFAQPLSGIERGRLNISCHSSSLIASSMYIFFFAFLIFWVDAITYNLHDGELFSLHKFSMHSYVRWSKRTNFLGHCPKTEKHLSLRITRR